MKSEMRPALEAKDAEIDGGRSPIGRALDPAGRLRRLRERFLGNQAGFHDRDLDGRSGRLDVLEVRPGSEVNAGLLFKRSRRLRRGIFRSAAAALLLRGFHRAFLRPADLIGLEAIMAAAALGHVDRVQKSQQSDESLSPEAHTGSSYAGPGRIQSFSRRLTGRG